jgi:hypothetical protein
MPKIAEAIATAGPKPSNGLTAGTSNYKATIEMGGQSVPLTVKSEVKEDGNAWIVSETASTPQGEISDVSTIEKGTLLLTRRVINQGPVAIELNMKDNKATGTMTVNGQARPISVDLGGSLFADGAGQYDVIAALPLAEGYAVGYRNLDVMKQKLAMKQLKVVGKESITVPAGTFDAYKVEITSADNEADKTMVWIARDTRKVLKISSVLTALNGAVLTSELVN